MQDKQKREVFSSLASRFQKNKGDKACPVRPPYNEDDSLFHQSCPSCIDAPCVTICEEDIIKIADDGTPFLTFMESGCTFCKECATACPSGVLALSEVSKDKINAKFSINTATCLAWNSVMCSSCLDACDERSVIFFGVFRPTIDMSKCTACGFCYGVCPEYCVEFKPSKEK